MALCVAQNTIVARMTSNQNQPNIPSNSEIIATFERLLLQASSTKVSTWSVRTFDRALGWAILAEKAKPGSETRAQCGLAQALFENPFTIDEIRERCIELLRQRSGQSVLRELDIKAAESDKLCKEAHVQIIKLGLDENEIMDRVIAKEILIKCRKSEEDRSYTMNHIIKNCNEAWMNVLCWMMIFCLPIDTWVHELFRTLHGSIQQNCHPSVESRARAKFETILS